MLDAKIEGELKKIFKLNLIIYIAIIIYAFIYAGIEKFMKQSAPQTGRVIEWIESNGCPRFPLAKGELSLSQQ